MNFGYSVQLSLKIGLFSTTGYPQNETPPCQPQDCWGSRLPMEPRMAKADGRLMCALDTTVGACLMKTGNPAGVAVCCVAVWLSGLLALGLLASLLACRRASSVLACLLALLCFAMLCYALLCFAMLCFALLCLLDSVGKLGEFRIYPGIGYIWPLQSYLGQRLLDFEVSFDIRYQGQAWGSWAAGQLARNDRRGSLGELQPKPEGRNG